MAGEDSISAIQVTPAGTRHARPRNVRFSPVRFSIKQVHPGEGIAAAQQVGVIRCHENCPQKAMHGFREAIHGLAEATFGLSKANHGIREPKLRRRAINRRPPKRNHGRAETSLRPPAWKTRSQRPSCH